jgi:hypothetical protein
MVEQKVRAIMIVEIAGRPPEHIRQALLDHVGRMKSMKGVNYISERISDTKMIDKEKDIYSCFVEVEIETVSFMRLTELMFDFLPSSIEVIEPDSIKFNSQEATMFLSDLSGRLHKYDEIAKVAQIKNQQLAQHLQKIQQAIAEHRLKKEVKQEAPKKDKKSNKKPVKKKSKK